MTGLRELIEAVEAGTAGSAQFLVAGYPDVRWTGEDELAAYRAYHGSVDAALALMEAVLPDFAIERMAKWPGHPARVSLFGTHEARDGSRWHSQEDGRFEAEADTPARALLLAILRAMEAMEG